MDLPIDKQEFDYIVTALWKCRKSENKCGDLYEKMKLVQEVMDANPDGMVIIKEYFVKNMGW